MRRDDPSCQRSAKVRMPANLRNRVIGVERIGSLRPLTPERDWFTYMQLKGHRSFRKRLNRGAEAMEDCLAAVGVRDQSDLSRWCAHWMLPPVQGAGKTGRHRQKKTTTPTLVGCS